MAQAAARHGVRFSEFMGWPESDRDMAVALDRVERSTGQNGEWLPDATSPRADPNYYEPDAIRFRVTGPHMNWAEKSRIDAEDAYRKGAGENPNLNGMFWAVEES